MGKCFEIKNATKWVCILSLALGANFANATEAEGQEYIDECAAAGVPTPPDWGSPDWEYVGSLTDEQEFISVEEEARVYKFQSAAPLGSCIGLPRVDLDSDEIVLLGIICLGTETSNACFWDNQENDVNVRFPVAQPKKLIDFAGGGELFGGGGGECTSCHAGENSFILHPDTPLGKPALGNLPVEPNDWYVPLVHPNWAQNDGPTNLLDDIESERKCTKCHEQGDSAGRFPSLYPESGYCRTVLQQAIKRTMPPNRPGDPRFVSHVNALKEACGLAVQPPSPQPLPQEDPIAFVGHGAFFDRSGNQIDVDEDFLLKAQRYYISSLTNQASPGGIGKFQALSNRVKATKPQNKQDELIANAGLLESLISTSQNAHGIRSKHKLILSKLKRSLSGADAGLPFNPDKKILDVFESESLLNNWRED